MEEGRGASWGGGALHRQTQTQAETEKQRRQRQTLGLGAGGRRSTQARTAARTSASSGRSCHESGAASTHSPSRTTPHTTACVKQLCAAFNSSPCPPSLPVTPCPASSPAALTPQPTPQAPDRQPRSPPSRHPRPAPPLAAGHAAARSASFPPRVASASLGTAPSSLGRRSTRTRPRAGRQTCSHGALVLSGGSNVNSDPSDSDITSLYTCRPRGRGQLLQSLGSGQGRARAGRAQGGWRGGGVEGRALERGHGQRGGHREPCG